MSFWCPSLSSKKTNENKSTSSKDEFVRLFFGRNVGLKNNFEFVWPLEIIPFQMQWLQQSIGELILLLRFKKSKSETFIINGL